MSTKDVIQLALASETDWSRFEQVVTEVLRSDDISSIRKIGGGKDQGLDGINETFFDGSLKSVQAIQITSQKSQRLKVTNTLAKLKKLERTPERLIVVFRDECSAATRREIREQAKTAGIEVDVRDQSYLLAELGRAGSTIFARFFGSDIRKQVDQLLNDGDPLSDAPDRLKQSVLATFSVFGSARDGARLGRGKLFDQSVLTAIASRDGLDFASVQASLEMVLPNVKIDDTQLRAALDRLKDSGSIHESEKLFRATSSTLARIALAAKHVGEGFVALMDFVVASVEESHGPLTDANKGALERNCRLALAQLVRLMGPTRDELAPDSDSRDWLSRMLSRDLTGEVGASALFAISAFVTDLRNQSLITPLIRAYSVIAIRNLDPLGRRWQEAALSRSVIVLDTDAVLHVLVQELPLHRPLLNAVVAFQGSGVKVVIPDRVLSEVVVHVENATRVYTRVGGDALTRLPEATAIATVWNAVTRGFWHARTIRQSITWQSYLAGYLDADDPIGFIRHILAGRLKHVAIEALDELREEDSRLLEELTSGDLVDREDQRLKSQFRDSDDRRERLSADLKIILNLSRYISSEDRFGYLVTEDRSFWIAEKSQGWKPRPRVSIQTRSLPEVADLCCGTKMQDSDLVNLMFEPAVIAAGELLKDEVEALASVGVDLRDVSLSALEWKLKKGLSKKIHAFSEAKAGGDDYHTEQMTLELIEVASNELKLDPAVKRVADGFRKLKEQSVGDRKEKEALQAALRDVLFQVAGDSRKGRARARHALKEFGLDEDAPSA